MGVARNRNAFQFAGDCLKTMREFVLSAMQVSGAAPQHVLGIFKGDPEIVEATVKRNGHALRNGYICIFLFFHELCPMYKAYIQHLRWTNHLPPHSPPR
jgi:hypothetical protein